MDWSNLHEEVGHAIEFRTAKGKEYPEDERNQWVVDALKIVQSELENCAGDHPTWAKIEQEFKWLADHPSYPDMCDFEEWNRYISRLLRPEIRLGGLPFPMQHR